MGSGPGSAAQGRRLKAEAQPDMANVQDELHSEDAKLEQGREGLGQRHSAGIWPGGQGWEPGRKIPPGTFLGPPTVTRLLFWKPELPAVGAPLPAFLTQSPTGVLLMRRGQRLRGEQGVPWRDWQMEVEGTRGGV